MQTVYLVDGHTRLILCHNQWAYSFREKLVKLGHEVIVTNQDPKSCVRDQAEMQRADELLTSALL